MIRRRAPLVFALGFFALATQVPLFRGFLAAFAGTELGVGLFFASWLLWSGGGALLGRLLAGRAPGLIARLELAALTYPPAFLLQQWLIDRARDFGGVSAYEVYPFGRMLAWGMAVNAPVSLVTGLLFTLACCWWEQRTELPTARVYALEALGGACGGLTATLLLAGGAAATTVPCLATLLLLAACAVAHPSAGQPGQAPGRPREPTGAVAGYLLATLSLGLGAALAAGLAGRWQRARDRAAWSRLLPARTFSGAFCTAQARYLYGRRDGQFLVAAWGGVREALPDTEHASQVLAMALAQHPGARRALVVGPGSLALCLRLLDLPQVEQVAWLHPDPHYPAALATRLPGRWRAAFERVSIPRVDARRYLAAHAGRFDLAFLNLPPPTTLVINRYWTREFLALVAGALTPRGVACARLPGGENFLGGELVHLGACALATMESVFARVELKPGEESWLLASRARTLVTDPEALRQRFARIPGGAAIYPPAGLLYAYRPDRARFQMKRYRQALARAGPARLMNSDARPRALLLGLLFTLRRGSVFSLDRVPPTAWTCCFWAALCPIVVYGVLRFIYLRTAAGTPGSGSVRAFDGGVLLFLTGAAAMGANLVLMLLYQSRHGALFLHVGVISSLFMLGSWAGSGVMSSHLRRAGVEQRRLLPLLLVADLALLGAVALMPEHATRVAFCLLFTGCGLVTGACFPLAARRLREAGYRTATAGSMLEALDHGGGALGALVTGCLLLPLLGIRDTLGVLAALVSVNLPPCLVRPRADPTAAGADRFNALARPAGYLLAGTAAIVLIVSHLFATAAGQGRAAAALAAARTLVKGARLQARRARRTDGAAFTYWTVTNRREQPQGYVLDTTPLVTGVSGYGGPLQLVVHLDPGGGLRGLRVAHSRETPAYLRSIRPWLRGLQGRKIFSPHALQGVDTVSGATMTSAAVLACLRQAGPRFARAALGRKVEAPTPARPRPDYGAACLVALLVLALVARRAPGRRSRLLALLATLLLTGVAWNLQYSSQQVMALLSLRLPGAVWSGSFLLVLLVPAVVALAGNVYCGYVCPFGALQELVGELRPRAWRTDPSREVWRYGRAVKYLLLALLVILYGLTRDYGVLRADPLLMMFSPLAGPGAWLAGAGLLLLCFWFRRFWCRNLCPAGAFLALLGRVRLLRFLAPPTRPAHCDLGVRRAGELDCICCDRCRHAQD